MMAVSCNDHYDETITVFVHQRSDEPEVRLVVIVLQKVSKPLQGQRQTTTQKIARIQTFNYRLKKGLGIMRHRKTRILHFHIWKF